MAKIDDLLSGVGDDKLRGQLGAAVADLRRNKKFGLVYEEHIPETVLLPAAGVREGGVVMLRRKPEDTTRYVVEQLAGNQATITDGTGTQTLPLADLLVVKAFGEPVYPVLRPTGFVKRNTDKAYHAVINGENFHALQLLLFAYKGQVDCIYIDPPYNTGSRDWKYNNDYVDGNDSWRHSKWLSMMEKRLRLAKDLLKPDGVLIVTIDEHEVHNLGVLLRDLFPDLPPEAIQMITIVINPKGVTQDRFSRVEEHAFFVFLGGAVLTSSGDDMLTLGADDIQRSAEAEGQEKRPRWKGLLRSGDASRREDRKDMFYPVLIDHTRCAVVDAGEPLPFDEEPDFDTNIGGLTPVWPVRRDGSLGRWGVGPATLRDLIAKGYVALGAKDDKRHTWGLSYLSKAPQEQIAAGLLEIKKFDEVRNVVDVVYTDPDSAARRMKTVWHRTRHDAGVGGSDVLRALLGERAFSFPKSVYAVRDTLAAVSGLRPNALILDFFAGSGTTLHATALLNAENGGHRRCILVTNNEVDEQVATKLNEAGQFFGDEEYEQRGVCRAVTIPRVTATLTGKRLDGTPTPGAHLGGRPYEQGFDENAVFLDLAYDDPDRIEIGNGFDDIIPTLWLAAGAMGDPDQIKPKPAWLLPDHSPLAVLLDEDCFRPFLAKLLKRPDVTHVWLVTDSEAAFARMRERIPGERPVGMLYRDYLRNFVVNGEVAR
jgi:adenine-specific DNA-methyltransferase